MSKRNIEVEYNELENVITVNSSTVQMRCYLPAGIHPRGGSSYARFWHIPVTVELSEQDILRDFVIGLHTPPVEKTRTYLVPFGTMWRVHLGATSIQLTPAEAADVCHCVDVVGQAYLDRLQKASSLLEVWNYPPVKANGAHGVYVLAIAAWLWPLMLQFARDHLWNRANSRWRILDVGRNHIVIGGAPSSIHATIRPVFDSPSVPIGYIGLTYEYPDRHLMEYELAQEASWQDHLGPTGFWTASYTEAWLIEQFIPKALSQACQPANERPSPTLIKRLSFLQRSPRNHRNGEYQPRGQLLFQRTNLREYAPLASIVDVMQLVPYLEDLQQWFHSYPVYYLPTDLIRPYYQALTDVAKHMEVTIEEDDYYLWNYVEGAFSKIDEEVVRREMEHGALPRYEQVLRALDLHVHRVITRPLEAHFQADCLSCAFLWLLRRGRSTCPSDRVRNALQAITPLWEFARFVTRYCSDAHR